MSEFKAGDRVYCPVLSEKIFTVDQGYYDYLMIEKPDLYFNKYGIVSKSSHPCIFHATPENHALLSQLYPNVEFEKPKPTGSDLTRQLLDEGAKEVLCWVSDEGDDVAVEKTHIASVVSHTPYKPSPYDGQLFTAKSGNHWKHAVPIPRSHYTMDDSDE